MGSTVAETPLTLTKDLEQVLIWRDEHLKWKELNPWAWMLLWVCETSFSFSEKSIRSTLSSSTKWENWAGQMTSRGPIQLTPQSNTLSNFFLTPHSYIERREPSWITKCPKGVMSLKLPSFAIFYPFRLRKIASKNSWPLKQQTAGDLLWTWRNTWQESDELWVALKDTPPEHGAD